MTTATIAEFLVRCGLVVLFLPFSALDKVLGFQGAVKQAQEVFRPRLIAGAAILAGLGIELVMTSGVVTGIADRLCALVLAGYCASTALLFKRFWAAGDFWQGPASKGRQLFWDFLKNLSLGSGFLVLVVGLDGSGLTALLAHPLGSTHPYSATGGKP